MKRESTCEKERERERNVLNLDNKEKRKIDKIKEIKKEHMNKNKIEYKNT